LQKKVNTKLGNAQEIIKQYGLTGSDFNNDEIIRFRNQVTVLKDTRHHSYVRHKISDVLVIVVLALLADADEWTKIEDFARKKEKWLREFLDLEHGIPSHDTIQFVLSILDPHQLSQICLKFLMDKIEALSEMKRRENPFKKPDTDIVSIDGKTSRGSAGNITGQEECRPLHTLNAVSSSYGICIGEVFVPDKTNEIGAVEDLLEILDVEGAVVTWDALNTQKKNIENVIDKKGDYVVALKGNHPNLHEEIRDYFNDEVLWLNNPLASFHKTVDKERSSIVTREYILSKEIDWIYDKKSWKGLGAIGCVRRSVIQMNGETTFEKQYYLSSITDVDLFARSARQHWSVESFHWQLDVIFRDDLNNTREKKSAKNLQIMKKTALAILKIVQPLYNKSMKRIRYSLSLDFENEIENIFSALDIEKVKSQLEGK